jgi:hypothetical protein
MGELEHKLAVNLFKWESIPGFERKTWRANNHDDLILTRYYNEGVSYAESGRYGMLSAQGMLIVINKMKESGFFLRIDYMEGNLFKVRFCDEGHGFYTEVAHRDLPEAVVKASILALEERDGLK